MVFSEVRVTSASDTPVLLLQEAEGTRVLPVWISASAGHAILSALEPSEPGHPTTHDLMLETLSALDVVVESFRIEGVDEGVYQGSLLVNGTAVSCRVSDGVALALRCGAAILATPEVISEAAVDLGDANGLPEADDVAFEQFREFLDSISADDFDEP